MFDNFNPQYNESRNELTGLSVRDLFYKYIRYFPLFIISVAIALSAAYVYLRYTVPTYSSTGSILIKDDKSKSGRGGDKFEELFASNSASNIQAEMEILKSKPLMRRVVDRLNLSMEVYGVGKIKTLNVYKKAPFTIVPLELKDSSRAFSFEISIREGDQYQIDGLKSLHRSGQEFTLPSGRFRIDKNQGGLVGNLYRVSWTPADILAAKYSGYVKVMPKTMGTGIINVSHESESAELSTDIVNQLMKEYSDYSVEQKKQSNDQILAFAEDRLRDIDHRLDSAQNEYLDFQIRNNIIDPESQLSSYFGKVDVAEKAGTEQEIKLNVIGMVDDYLADKKNDLSKVVVPSTLGLEDITLNQLIGAYNQAQLERKLLLDGNVPVSNASVVQLDGQLEKLRLSIRENLRNIRAATGSLLSSIRAGGQIGQSQLSSMPTKIKELAEIKRQVATYQALHELFLTKREETAIARASTVSNSSVVDVAALNQTPVSPNRKSVQLIAFLIGIALPAIFIFLAELFNDKILSRFDIEKITPTPILGEVGHSFSENMLVASKGNRSMVAEQFRIIRSNLQYFLQKKEKATILVTSTFSGEGKTYVSSNIAAVHALAGKKTVLLEFDIRKPKILSGLNMEKGPGISNYLVGKVDDISMLIRPVASHDNLFVMGCGPVPPNPAELLLDERINKLFQYLQSNFDFVVIDTAPVGMVSDAMTIGKFADCTIYLTRQNYSFKKQLALIDDLYQQKRLPGLSLILNDVKMQGGYGYYGYGRYGYGSGYGNSYGYSSYFDEEKKPKTRIDSLKGWWKGLWG